MPESEAESEPGMNIRYGYLDVTEDTFRLREDDGRFFVGKMADSAGSTTIEEIEIGSDAFRLLTLAMKNKYVRNIRYAVTDEHNRFVMDENAIPEGVYLGEPIVGGRLYTVDQGIEVRDKGGDHFMARRLAARPIWNGGDVTISSEVFEFFWGCDGPRIEKTRYRITDGNDRNVAGHIWSVDRYSRPCDDLVVAKVVLPNDGIVGILPASIAAVAIKDVSGDPRFRGGNLAKDGLRLAWSETRELGK